MASMCGNIVLRRLTSLLGGVHESVHLRPLLLGLLAQSQTRAVHDTIAMNGGPSEIFRDDIC